MCKFSWNDIRDNNANQTLRQFMPNERDAFVLEDGQLLIISRYRNILKKFQDAKHNAESAFRCYIDTSVQNGDRKTLLTNYINAKKKSLEMDYLISPYDLLIEFWTVVPMTPVIWSRFESGIYTFSEFLQAIKMLIKKEKIHSEDLGRINDPAIENIILNRDQELSSELNFNISEVDSYSWRA